MFGHDERRFDEKRKGHELGLLSMAGHAMPSGILSCPRRPWASLDAVSFGKRPRANPDYSAEACSVESPVE